MARVANIEGNVPGTVQLVDVDHILNTKHSSTHRDIVLVPVPSDHPDDPLNWTGRRKLLSTICLSLYIFMEGISTAAIYSVLVPMSESTGLSVDSLNKGTGYMFLLFGWGCLFWQPVALQYGKRPVYLISLAATIAIMIWQPYTKTSGQYLASKILQGFFGAPIESLCEISIADIWFQHERGTYLAMYGFLLAGSNYFAPLIMGFIEQKMGLNWVFYWSAIFCGIALLFNLFFMEETNWVRVAEDHSEPKTTEGDKINVKVTKQEMNSSVESQSSENSHPTGEPRAMKSQKTFLQKMSLIPQRTPFRLFQIFPRPFLFFSLPAVVWSGFQYGLSLVWFNVMNATSSSILSATPYNFSASMVGLTYLAPLLGSFVSSIYSGRLGDWWVLHRTRVKGGTMEPEYRVWLFALSMLVTPFSLILWGVGAAHRVHWFGLIFAFFMGGVQSSLSIALSVTYALDSYRDIGGETIVTVILIRNTMSFAVNYGITPWVTNMGKQNAFILAAFVSFGGLLTFLPMIWYGKRLRKWSALRYAKFVEQERRLGLVH